MTDDYNEMMEDGTEFLDIDTSDAKEPVVMEEGEFQIRITGFSKDNNGRIIRESDSGFKYFRVNFDIPAEEYSKGFSHMFSVPTEDMEPKKVNQVKWSLDVFKRAFGLEDLNFGNMVGREGFALLGIEESEEYGDRNRIKSFIAGA